MTLLTEDYNGHIESHLDRNFLCSNLVFNHGSKHGKHLKLVLSYHSVVRGRMHVGTVTVMWVEMFVTQGQMVPNGLYPGVMYYNQGSLSGSGTRKELPGSSTCTASELQGCFRVYICMWLLDSWNLYNEICLLLV